MPSITKKAQKRHRCSNCDARFGYFREGGKEWVCRACGNVENSAPKNPDYHVMPIDSDVKGTDRKKLIDIFKEDLG